jgi:glutamyl-Q tRNA(Asp) synthetase
MPLVDTTSGEPSESPVVTGRFAPSPTGPLHFGSLVAAVGSWLFARHAGGRWLVRMEDLDTPRVVPGAADEILRALERYRLEWDGEVVYQSQRQSHYEKAEQLLRKEGVLYPCACTRAELRNSPSAPAADDQVIGESIVYPGTCRQGLPPGKTARAWRFAVPSGVVEFDDLVAGHIREEVSQTTGDFVVRRADGLFAYQLAVVVDDAAQGVTQVVRGGDLLSSTARQIALQRTLALPTPRYAHLPLIVGPDGKKLGKRDGSLPLPTLDQKRIVETLRAALTLIGVSDLASTSPSDLLQEALTKFDPLRITRASVVTLPALP